MARNIDERLIWLNGNLMPVNEAQINVLAPTSQFGLNVFEGIRCYWNEEKQQLFAFRLEDHFKRLKRSQKLLYIEDEYTIDELTSAFLATVRANEYKEDIAVRQTIFVYGFGSWSSSAPVGMFISPIPKAKTSAEYNKKGLHCCVSSWERINEKSLSPRIKCGANYINSRMAQLEALRNGFDTAIFLNNKGKVSEGPGSCLFIVKDGKLITPQLSDSVLESITRDTLLRLSEELGIEAAERSLEQEELYSCDEAFLCGSAMEITPIFSIDKKAIGNGQTGNITTMLHKAYLELVTGNSEKHKDWLTEVYVR